MRELERVWMVWTEQAALTEVLPELRSTPPVHSCCPTWPAVSRGSDCISKVNNLGKFPLTLSASDIGADMISVYQINLSCGGDETEQSSELELMSESNHSATSSAKRSTEVTRCEEKACRFYTLITTTP